jgi:hypothetical protein
MSVDLLAASMDLIQLLTGNPLEMSRWNALQHAREGIGNWRLLARTRNRVKDADDLGGHGVFHLLGGGGLENCLFNVNVIATAGL